MKTTLHHRMQNENQVHTWGRSWRTIGKVSAHFEQLLFWRNPRTTPPYVALFRLICREDELIYILLCFKNSQLDEDSLNPNCDAQAFPQNHQKLASSVHRETAIWQQKGERPQNLFRSKSRSVHCENNSGRNNCKSTGNSS